MADHYRRGPRVVPQVSGLALVMLSSAGASATSAHVRPPLRHAPLLHPSPAPLLRDASLCVSKGSPLPAIRSVFPGGSPPGGKAYRGATHGVGVGREIGPYACPMGLRARMRLGERMRPWARRAPATPPTQALELAELRSLRLGHGGIREGWRLPPATHPARGRQHGTLQRWCPPPLPLHRRL